MGRELTDDDFIALKEMLNSGDRIGYYDQLNDWGYPYGDLASGVVDGSSFAGRFANHHLKTTALENGVLATNNVLEKIGVSLAWADFAIRSAPDSPNRIGNSLSVKAIEGYHHSVFKDFGIPPEAWTATYPLEYYRDNYHQLGFDSPSEAGAALWDSMVNGGIGSRVFLVGRMSVQGFEEFAWSADMFWQGARYSDHLVLGISNEYPNLLDMVDRGYLSINIMLELLSSEIGRNKISLNKQFDDGAYPVTEMSYNPGKKETLLLDAISQEGGIVPLIEDPITGHVSAYVNGDGDVVTTPAGRYTQEYIERWGEEYERADGSMGYRVGFFESIGAIFGIGGRDTDNGGGDNAKPIILDLDGDGVELSQLDESTAFYDINGESYRQNVAWASADDGFLVIDIGGDGIIDQKDELVFVDYVEGAETDLEGLAYFDTNGDGVLNALDTATADKPDAGWEKFGVWQDLDQDGETDAGEFHTLDEMSITEINLTSDEQEQIFADGTVFHGLGEYTRNGTTHVFADAALAASVTGFREEADGTVKIKVFDETTRITASTETDIDGNAIPSTVAVTLDVSDQGDDVIGHKGGAGDDTLSAGVAVGISLEGGDGDDTLNGSYAMIGWSAARAMTSCSPMRMIGQRVLLRAAMIW